VKVSDYPALATVGGVALITAGGSPLAIVRTGTNSFVALSRICPHQGAIVSTGTNGFTCPRHGARFSSTGTWIGGQSTSSLRSYPTSYDDSTSTLTIG
jgi:cytochrome b6-f complex iron-sulfur subunit